MSRHAETQNRDRQLKLEVPSNLKLRYANTKEDAVAFSLFLASESLELRRAVAGARWSAGIAAAVTVVAFSIRNLSALTFAVGLTVGAATGAGFGELWRWLLRRNVAKSAARIVSEHFACEHELRLEDTELVETTQATEHRIMYRAIHRIVRTDDHVFIFVDKALAHVIPVVAASNDLTAFVSELEARRLRAGA
jgi:hypothetical protein